jgi:hypothetical protein
VKFSGVVCVAARNWSVGPFARSTLVVGPACKKEDLYCWLNPWKEELDCGTTDLAKVLVRTCKDLISSSWILMCLVVIEAHRVGGSDANCHTPN